jgi:hypothetical protein
MNLKYTFELLPNGLMKCSSNLTHNVVEVPSDLLLEDFIEIFDKISDYIVEDRFQSSLKNEIEELIK